jgi:transcriptional regulator with XRE-family HTH domain
MHDGKLGDLLRVARQSCGLSLSRVALLTGYSKSYLGLLETGVREVRPEHVDAYERALGMPVGRLASAASAPRTVDNRALDDLAVVLYRMRRLEDLAGATAVLPAMRGICVLAMDLARQARGPAGPEALNKASEMFQYRAWLELTTSGPNAADRWLQHAIRAGTESTYPEPLARALTAKAYAGLVTGDATIGLDYTGAAMRLSRVEPSQRVYHLHQMARAQAVAGEHRRAEQTLAAAERQAGRDRSTPPDSGYWLTPGFWLMQRGRILWELGHHDEAITAIRDGLAALPPDHAAAEWASKWVAAASTGDGTRL